MSAIRVHHARTHNLRDVSVTLPAGGLTVLTGVSGSGKSSLAFDTLHAEGRRRYLEALGAQDGSLRRPAVEAVEGLPPTLALRQHVRAPGPHDTVAEASEAAEALAVVWARAGVQHDPDTGEAIHPRTHDAIVKDLLDGPEGARLLIEAPLLPSPDTALAALLDEVRLAGFSRVRLHGEVRRVDDVDAAGPPDPDLRVVVDRLKLRADRRPRLAEALRTAGAAGRGVIVAVFPDDERVYVDRPFSLSSRRTFPDLTPARFNPRGAGGCPTCQGTGHVDEDRCPDCGGLRLTEASRHVRYQGATLPDAWSWPAADLLAWLEGRPSDPRIDAALDEARRRVRALCDLGLGHLPLDRRLRALSGGEARRLRLARLAGTELSGVLYLLDEPTAGLDAPAADAVLAVIRRLVEGGSTVVVVSHREAVVRAADHLIELGPGAGQAGGRVIHEGPIDGVVGGDTPTGRWLAGALPPPEVAPAPEGKGVVIGGHDLLPRAVHAVHGPGGAGLSRTLGHIADAVSGQARDGDPIDRVLWVDDRRTGSTRSMVATFVGAWDVLRELLAATTEARIRGLTASHFSLATKGGRCEACKGQGEVKVDLGLLPPVWLTCEICDGKRFQQDVLDITWKAHSPAALLDLEAEAAWRLLAGHPKLERTLRALVDVGLGYVPIGQSTASLSGGEAARLRLARELGRTRRGVDGALVVVDGPTDGLHPVDAAAQIALLHRLAEAGATVVVASHDPRVIEAAHRRIPVG